MHVAFLMNDQRVLYGAERATLDLASGLADSGEIHVSAILIGDRRTETSASMLEAALRDHSISCRCIPTARRFSPGLVRKIREEVESNGVDCLHVIGYKAAVHGGLAVRFGRLRPWVSTVHGWLERPDAKERFYAWLDIQMLKRAQRVIALSEFYLKKLSSKGVPAEQLLRIPSGLRLDDLDVDRQCMPFCSSERLPTIGILGRLSWEKNHEMFLSAARRLLDGGWRARFLVAGDGPERRRIESMVCRLGLEASVELAGVMNREDFFRQIDLLALCSKIENLPYVILEAMAWSRPVVATSVGGVPDLIKPGENGLLVESDDAGQMAEAIGQLLNDAPRAQAMGRTGRTCLEQRFTLSRSVQAHLAMYRELSDG
ncbi:glycosyltransferase [Bacteroidota bacterium]